jgi:hypothetical protein
MGFMLLEFSLGIQEFVKHNRVEPLGRELLYYPV